MTTTDCTRTPSIVITADGVAHLKLGATTVAHLPAHEYAVFVGRAFEALETLAEMIGTDRGLLMLRRAR
jgi:hypothetical protein